jgi:DNA mismatch repair protein MSH4
MCDLRQALELTVCQNFSGRSSSKQKATLLGWLGHTNTKCGAALLRANILQPLTHAETLKLRYEALAELIEDEAMSFGIASSLRKLPKNLV